MQSDEPTDPTKQVNIEVGNLTASDSATVNIAGGNIIQAAAGATVIIGAQAGAGLLALNDLVQLSPEVRAAVGTFAADFKAATSQVDVMGDYKDLHDLLHQTQFYCYMPILREMTRFPDDSSLELLEDYERSMRDILVKLGDVGSRQRVAETDTAFITELDQAHTDLKSALDDSNANALNNCIRRLKRILSKYPVIIDTRLNGSARALRMDALIAALMEIQKDLTALKVDADKVEKFIDGLCMLQSMDEKLTVLLADHEKWQSVDIELRRIESLSDQDLSELEFSWPDVKAQASPLYENCTDVWAVSIQGYANQLDQFLSANNIPKIRQAFRNFVHETASHFFQVDINLKSLCSELRQIGDPLSSIIRSIE